MNKISIIILLLLVLGVGGYVYLNKTNTAPVTDNNNQPATTTPVTPVQTTTEYPYDKLSATDKAIIDRYTEKYPQMYQQILGGDTNFSRAKSQILIKYEDGKTVALAVPNGKTGLDVSIFDITTFNQLDKNPLGMTLFGNFLETDKYIIVVYDTVIVYYKKGSTDIITVPKSELNSKTETYIKLGGFGSTYDFKFDEGTKTITASIFKPENKEGKENTKIRTATFILP